MITPARINSPFETYSLVFLCFLTLLTAGIAHAAVPTFVKVKSDYTSSEATLLDRHGEIVQELRVDPFGRRLEWKTLREISPALQDAVIQSEDRRFYDHGGVDWRALGYAFATNWFSAHRRGASTITMQLASLIEKRRSGRARRGWREKWQQIQKARGIEQGWSKVEILEAYLNLVSFRGELQGVTAAARGLFEKEPHGLADHEAWILAALIRSPNAPPEKVAERACRLGRLQKYLENCAAIVASTQAGLAFRFAIKPSQNLAPHVAEQLLKPMRRSSDQKILSVSSTLDGQLQRFVVDVLREQLLALKAQNVKDGAVLVLDNQSGDVLAYVGNSGVDSSARFVDGVRAPRQAGSTLKPFLYALAFERKLLTPASPLDDSALDVTDARGTYRPKNYDERYHSLVSARVALASSLNIPAVRTLALVGNENFLGKLRELGFAGLKEDGEFYGPALALGSADVSLWNMVNAYRALANGGVWSISGFEPAHKRHERRVFSAESAFLAGNILSDRESRSLTFGFEGPLATRFWTAVKTGTSKDMHDNWCIGYSSRYTVGVWIGNFAGAPMWNVSGTSGAAPVWLEVMNWLHRGEPSFAPAAPTGVRKIHLEDPRSKQARAEWFIEGTEPSHAAIAQAPQFHPKIVYPVDGTAMALDPDIPQERQKIFFEAKPHDPRLQWVLNGKPIGDAGNPVSWLAQTGTYSLTLIDREQRVVDRVVFSVKGKRDDSK